MANLQFFCILGMPRGQASKQHWFWLLFGSRGHRCRRRDRETSIRETIRRSGGPGEPCGYFSNCRKVITYYLFFSVLNLRRLLHANLDHDTPLITPIPHRQPFSRTTHPSNTSVTRPPLNVRSPDSTRTAVDFVRSVFASQIPTADAPWWPSDSDIDITRFIIA